MLLPCILLLVCKYYNKTLSVANSNCIMHYNMKFEFWKKCIKPCYGLKIVKIAKIIFKMSPFILVKLNQYRIQKTVCLRLLEVGITFGTSCLTF